MHARRAIMTTCPCAQHSGPCWLYDDYQKRTRNITLLRTALQHAIERNYRACEQCLHGYLTEERERLMEKLPHIEPDRAYPYSLLGDGYDADLAVESAILMAQISEIVQAAREAGVR